MTPAERAAERTAAAPMRYAPPGPTLEPPRDDAATLRAYVDAIVRRRALVVTLPVVLGVVALGLNMLRPRDYAARAAFIASEPSSASGALGSLGSVASQLGIPALAQVASGSASLSAQFYGDLLTSDAVLSAAVATRYDASAPGDYGGPPFRGTLVDYFHADGRTAADRRVDAMRRLAHRALAVSVDRPTGVVRFEVRTHNRALSALVARRLIDLVNDFNLRRRQTQAGNERDFTAQRTDAARAELRAAESALAEFRTANIDFSRSPRLAERETELQRRVTLAGQIYTTVAQRHETASIEAVRTTPVITVLDAPEGLVEARPRYTAAVALGAVLAGLVLAVALALGLERRRR